MKKYLLSASLILFTLLLITDFDSQAFCRKKRKKRTQTSKVAPADSNKAVRAPGVKNQHELDSIKRSKVKQPQ
ncbi:MAG: hypothetical protein IT257_12755 [Chitinophagaceae bacterium]|nr:hypothetical protein [Chitinophagaceae bacterium]